MDYLFKLECEREGLNPAAVERLCRHLAMGAGYGSELDAACVLFPEIESDVDSAAEYARKEAAEELEQARRDACYDALHELRRGGAPRARIEAAFRALVTGAEFDDWTEFQVQLGWTIDELTDPDAAQEARVQHESGMVTPRSFDQWVTRVVGGRWCVGRLTKKKAAEGFKVGLSKKRVAELRAAYEAFDALNA